MAYADDQEFGQRTIGSVKPRAPKIAGQSVVDKVVKKYTDQALIRQSRRTANIIKAQQQVQELERRRQQNIITPDQFRSTAAQQLRAETGFAGDAEVRQRAYELATQAALKSGRPGRLETRGVNEQLGKANPNRQIQPLRRVESAVAGGLERAGEATGIPGAPQVGRALGQYAVPTTLTEAELGLLPGVGYADDVADVARLGKGAARIAAENPSLRRLALEEFGGGRIPGGGDEIVETATDLVPTEAAKELELTPVEQLKMALKTSQISGLGENLRARTDELRAVERGQRFGQLNRNLQDVETEADFDRAVGVMKGEYSKEVSETAPRELIDQPVLDELFRTIARSSLRGGDKLSAKSGLKKLLMGEPPQPSEIRLMEEAGLGVREFLPRNKAEWDRWKLFGEAINLPRSVMATADISASLRQAFFFAFSHPKEYLGSFVEQLRAFKSEDNALAVEGALRNHKWRPEMDQAGLYLAPVEDMRDAALSQKEEQWISNLLDNIPGVGRVTRASARAYSTMLNKLRADTFATIVEGWQRDNIPLTEDRLKNLALYINNATGRGSLGKVGNEITPVLNAVFFSPRFVASRFQLLADLGRSGQDRYVRQQAARDWVIFVGTGMTALTLLKQAPGVDVEVSPFSSDFGKVKIGNTRFDFWAGFQQPARYTAQIMAGKQKLQSGRTKNLDAAARLNLGGRFIRSKLAPIPSSVADVWDQQTMAGEPLNVKNSVIEKFTPLFTRDVYEAIQEYRTDTGAWWDVRSYKTDPQGAATIGAVAALAPLGAGSQTYETKTTIDDDAIKALGMDFADYEEFLSELKKDAEAKGYEYTQSPYYKRVRQWVKQEEQQRESE